MKRFPLVIILSALLALAGALNPAVLLAEEVSFTGKVFSPNGFDVLSQHVFSLDGVSAAPGNVQIKVVRMLVKEGDTVAFEQPLMEYTLPANVVEAELKRVSQQELRRADLQVDKLRLRMNEKARELAEKEHQMQMGQASRQDVDYARQDLNLARSQVDIYQQLYASEKDRQQDLLRLFRTKFGDAKPGGKRTDLIARVYAQDAGVVLKVNPVIVPGMVLSAPTPLFRIGKMDPVIMRALVHESMMVKLKEGEKARVTFEVLPGRSFDAVLSRVSMTANQTLQEFPSFYEVQLTVANPDMALKEGMRGNVVVNTGS